jgi:hypothetical protein
MKSYISKSFFIFHNLNKRIIFLEKVLYLLIIIALCAQHVQNYDEFQQSDYKSECYDSATGVAKKCMPEFINAGKFFNYFFQNYN